MGSQGGPLTTAIAVGTSAPTLMLRDSSLPEDHKAVGMLLHSSLRWLFAGPQRVLKPGALQTVPASLNRGSQPEAASSVHSGCKSFQVYLDDDFDNVRGDTYFVPSTEPFETWHIDPAAKVYGRSSASCGVPGCELRLGNVRLRRHGKHAGLPPWVLPTLQCVAVVPSLAAVPALFPAADAYILSQVSDMKHAARAGL